MEIFDLFDDKMDKLIFVNLCSVIIESLDFISPMSTILPEPDIIIDPSEILEIPLPKNWTDYMLLAILHIIALVRIIQSGRNLTTYFHFQQTAFCFSE
jgi:hypothetical protein